jgi:hypothetical protein
LFVTLPQRIQNDEDDDDVDEDGNSENGDKNEDDQYFPASSQWAAAAASASTQDGDSSDSDGSQGDDDVSSEDGDEETKEESYRLMHVVVRMLFDKSEASDERVNEFVVGLMAKVLIRHQERSRYMVYNMLLIDGTFSSIVKVSTWCIVCY